MNETPRLMRAYVLKHLPQAFVHPVTGEIALPFGLDGAWWWLRVKIDDERDHLSVVSQLPVLTPVARRPAMAAYLERLDAFLPDGFHLDPDRDGEVRFVSELSYGDATVSTGVIEDWFAAHLVAVPRCLPGMLAVAYRDADPEEEAAAAIQSIRVATGTRLWEEGLIPLAGLLVAVEAATLFGVRRPYAHVEAGADAAGRAAMAALQAARARLLDCLAACIARRAADGPPRPRRE